MHAPQISESWQVTTAVGVTVCTFGSEDHAMTWLRIRKSELPGAYVEKVTTTVTRSADRQAERARDERRAPPSSTSRP